MQKKTWKKIALTTTSVAVAAVVITVKLAIEFEKIWTQNTELLKEMADEGLIHNLKIGDETYEVNN